LTLGVDGKDVDFLSIGKFVKLSKDIYTSLCNEYGKGKVDDIIASMNDWIAAKGKKPYKDYAAAIRQWIRKDIKENKPKVVKF
jgi:hypothetical protein